MEELRKRQDRYEQLYDYYIGDQPILYRTMESDAAKNNKLVNNFCSYIAEICADFLLGNPVDYQAQPDDIDIDEIMKLYTNQGMSDTDSDLALDAGIYGVAYDLTFADENSDPQTVQIDTRNALMVYDDSVKHNELFAITCAQTKERMTARRSATSQFIPQAKPSSEDSTATSGSKKTEPRTSLVRCRFQFTETTRTPPETLNACSAW